MDGVDDSKKARIEGRWEIDGGERRGEGREREESGDGRKC
jgi:hypothetical protein